jgi:RNA polymerase sigma factor (sigma-70 family)
VSGDQVSRATFVGLYRAQFAHMVRVAWLIVGSAALAEDIVQEAFIRVGARYDTIERPEAYLRTAVVNGCRNELRRLRRIATEPPPEELVNDPELVTIFDALSSLTGRHRAVLVLRYVDDRSDEDIAELLGVRRSTVRSLVRRSLGTLRESLREEEQR